MTLDPTWQSGSGEIEVANGPYETVMQKWSLTRMELNNQADTARKKLHGVCVETEFFRQLKTTLQEQRTVLLTGHPGDGKTSMAVMMSKSLEREGYATEYNESASTVDVDAIAKTEKGVFLVIDNAFGRCRYDQRKSELLQQKLSKIRAIEAQTERVSKISEGNQAGVTDEISKKPLLVLILSRVTVFQHAESNIPARWLNICILDTRDNLQLKEMKTMLKKHCEKMKKRISEDNLDAIARMRGPRGFPAICGLYAKFASSETDIINFFCSPLAVLTAAASQKMKTKAMYKFALALMVLEESVYLPDLEEDEKKMPKHLNQSIETVAKCLNKSMPIDPSELANAMKEMYRDLLEEEDGFVSFSFDNAKEAVSLAFVDTGTTFVARHCSLDFITDHIRLAGDESRSSTKHSYSVTKTASRNHWKLFKERLLKEIEERNLKGVFAKSSFLYQAFLDEFLGHLANSRKREDIAHIRDESGLSFLFWVSMTSFTKFHIFKQMKFTDDEIWEALCACCATGHASQVEKFCRRLSVPPKWTKALCEHPGQAEDRMNFSLNTCPALQKHKSIPGTLAAAAADGHTEVLETLLDLGMPVDVQNTFGETPLMHACGAGHKVKVELLVEKGANIILSDRNGCNAFHWAAWFDCKEAVDILMQTATPQKQDLLNSPNASGRRPLMLACWKSPGAARLLIANGVDTNLTDKQDKTCLHYASRGSDPDLVQDLIEKYGMAVNAVDGRGFSPLHQACAKPGNQKIVKVLLNAGADPNARATGARAQSRPPAANGQKRPVGVTPLHVACTSEKQIVNLLLEKDVEIDALDEANQTPIAYACNHGEAEIVGILLRKGASVQLRDSDDNTILHHASKGSCVSVVNSILDYQPEMLNAKNRQMLTPLCVACGFGNTHVVCHLISQNADTKKSDENGGNVLHISSSKGQVDVTKFLVEKVKIDINARDKNQWTPLMLACFFGRERVICYLVLNEADTLCEDENGYTIMHLVAANGNSAALQYVEGQKRMEIDVKSKTKTEKPDDSQSEIDYILSMRHVLKAGADPSRLDRYGNCPLHHAAAGGNRNIIQYLLDEVHILVDETNKDENTPFLMACISGQTDALKHFHTRGANIKAKDRFGNTAVHHGSSEGHLEVLEYLVETLDLDVNEKNFAAETPLDVAMMRKRTNVYRFLLEHGARVDEKDNNGNTPLHTAAAEGNKPLAENLLDYGHVEVDMKNSDGETPLHCASWHFQTEMVRFLIERGASIYAMCGCDNHLPVHLAAKRKDLATMKVLLEKDPQTIDAACGTGQTPLCHCCEGVDVKTSEPAQFLIQFDTASDHRKNGDTSLHVAARGGHMTTVKALVEKVQMKVDVLNHKRETPLDCARAAGHSEIVTYLEKKASQ